MVLLAGAAALFAAAPAMAQVGHPPDRSPFLDLEHNQELTFVGGWMKARHDPAGVAPLSRPAFGVRYELTLTGPLALSSDIWTAFGSRNVVDPLKPAATRSIGTQSNVETALDLALAMNLPGTRSWHRLVPQVRGGIGFVHNGAKDDSSGFAFGTPFAFSLGGGLKYVPGGKIQLRADLSDHIFKLGYPDAYYRLASDNTTVIPASTPRSFYTHHTMFTVGVSYLFGR